MKRRFPKDIALLVVCIFFIQSSMLPINKPSTAAEIVGDEEQKHEKPPTKKFKEGEELEHETMRTRALNDKEATEKLRRNLEKMAPGSVTDRRQVFISFYTS